MNLLRNPEIKKKIKKIQLFPKISKSPGNPGIQISIVPGNSGIQKLKNAKVKKSRSPEIQQFRNPEIKDAIHNLKFHFKKSEKNGVSFLEGERV